MNPENSDAVPVVEKKVTAATIGAGGVVALILAALSAVQSDQLIDGLPDWVPLLLGVAIAALTTLAAGHQAPHTPRPDLPAAKR